MKNIFVALLSLSVLVSSSCYAFDSSRMGYGTFDKLQKSSVPDESGKAAPETQGQTKVQSLVENTPKTEKKPSKKAVEPQVPQSDVVTNEEAFTVMAGDVLQITVWKEDSLDKEVIVLQDNTITFPLIGTVKVQGLSPSALESTIKKMLDKFIPDATVSVMVKAPLGHTVSVIGQVTKPGEIIMSRPIGVMEALSQVGGLTPYADTSSIVILRNVDGKKISIEFPYNSVSRGYKLESDIPLKAKDVVVVPTGGLF